MKRKIFIYIIIIIMYYYFIIYFIRIIVSLPSRMLLASMVDGRMCLWYIVLLSAGICLPDIPFLSWNREIKKQKWLKMCFYNSLPNPSMRSDLSRLQSEF